MMLQQTTCSLCNAWKPGRTWNGRLEREVALARQSTILILLFGFTAQATSTVDEYVALWRRLLERHEGLQGVRLHGADG